MSIAEYYQALVNLGIGFRSELRDGLFDFVSSKYPNMSIRDFELLERQLFMEFVDSHID